MICKFCQLMTLIMWLPMLAMLSFALYAGYKFTEQTSHVVQTISETHKQNPIIIPSFEELRAFGFGEHSLMEQRFSAWAKSFSKEYPDETERRKRFQNFLVSESMIKAHSTKSEAASYSLGLNQFADWSHEEFMEFYNFGKMQGQQECSATSKNLKQGPTPIPADLPPSIDWREKGIVTPVKNQGHCGSCWTFSTTGALEAHLKKLTGRTVSLSEQQLLDCAGNYDNHGCNGGLPSHAFQFIKETGGLDTERAYKYEAVEGACRFKKWGVGVRVKEVVNITQFDENQLQIAVGKQGPVSIAFQVAGDFRLYTGGVYTSKECKNQPKDVNHAVLAVGYGTTPEGLKYWIVKNSWGSTWGDKGFFMIERGKNMCGVADCASYPVVSV